MICLLAGPTFWCQKVGKPITKAAQACFIMGFNFSAECDCNLNPLWFYGFGGLWPDDDFVPYIAKTPAWRSPAELENPLSVFLPHPRQSNLIFFILIRVILNA
jgi:hypothetical protein